MNEHDSSEALDRTEWDAADLMANHPPRIRNANKQVVFEIAMGGAEPRGNVAWSRWPALELPDRVDLDAGPRALEIRVDHYDYAPVLDGPDAVEWHVNFADPNLFVAYAGSLFAQDEMQVAEHPVLGSVLEALRAEGRSDRTVDDGDRPTPVLVTGAERRVRVATNANADAGRPHGLYGNAFARASADALRAAAIRLDPPTISNLLGIAAPRPRFGRYRPDEIEAVLVTGFSGFRAAVVESARLVTGRPRVAIHTGYWGCGAFGGNRTLMAMLQVVAAGMAGVDRLVFHAGVAGSAPVRDALTRIEGREVLPTATLIDELTAAGFEWGVSDGN